MVLGVIILVNLALMISLLSLANMSSVVPSFVQLQQFRWVLFWLSSFNATLTSCWLIVQTSYVTNIMYG
jgi:hypothetical protein